MAVPASLLHWGRRISGGDYAPGEDEEDITVESFRGGGLVFPPEIQNPVEFPTPKLTNMLKVYSAGIGNARLFSGGVREGIRYFVLGYARRRLAGWQPHCPLPLPQAVAAGWRKFRPAHCAVTCVVSFQEELRKLG